MRAMRTRSELSWLLMPLTLGGVLLLAPSAHAEAQSAKRPTVEPASPAPAAAPSSTPSPAPVAQTEPLPATQPIAPAPDAAAPEAPPTSPSGDPAAEAPAPPSPEALPTSSTGPRSYESVARALEEGAVDLDIDALVVPESELDHALTERASGPGPRRWLIGYRVTQSGELARLEVTAVPPDSTVRRVAVDTLDESRLELRSMVLLREAVQVVPQQGAVATNGAADKTKTRSSGRAILALNGALLGGYIGVSLQQASDSEDDRLLYPLAALGVGLGLGASMLVADEWDITTEDAWFISAGLIWPTASGTLLAASYDVAPNEQYLFGLSGATVGMTLAGVTVARGGVHSGSAAIAHSGGAFGQGLGALTQGIVEGNLEEAPLRGMGYGTGIGVLGAGVLATQLETSPSRVLLVDLAALLGGLTGGALATPLLLVDDVTDSRRRMWFGAIATGTVIGGVLGVVATEDEDRTTASAAPYRLLPYGGVIGTSTVGTRSAPAYGAGVQGFF